MAHGRVRRASSSFLLAALAATLILVGILGACSKAQTTTTAPKSTTASGVASATASAPAATTSSARTSTTVSAADFYKSNVLTIVVPYPPGGTTDYAARLFSTFWTQATGGRMIIDNKVGAGGYLGANYVYAAKPDGLTMGVGIHGAGLIAPTLAQDPAVKFDIRKMNWIEMTNPEGLELSISSKSPYNSMLDLAKEKGLKFASTGRSTTTSLSTGLAIDFFGLQDARIVVGYTGTQEGLLAVAKGEAIGYATGYSDIMLGVNQGFVKPFLTLNTQRAPHFPDVPTIADLIKLTPEQDALLRTLSALVVGQVFWFQPGVPQDRIDFVRNAFDKMVAMDEFKAQLKIVWPVYIKPVSGKDYAAEFEKTLAIATPERYSELQKIADKYMR